MRSKVEQGRAAKALEYVTKAPKTDEFKSYAKKVPMMIKSHGLAPALAFIKSKNRQAYNTIYADIIKWLKDDIKKVAPDIHTKVTNNTDTGFIDYLINLEDPAVYRAITNEVLAFLNWYRRFAEAITA